MRALALSLPCALLALAGCTTPNSIKLPTQRVTVGDFVQQVKHELSVFDERKAKLGPVASKCGPHFDLTPIKATVVMNVVVMQSTSGEASAEIPLGSATIGPNFAASSGITGTQAIKFSVYPKATAGLPSAPQSEKFVGTPIADALTAVYEGFKQGSGYAPCLSFGEIDKQENSVIFGVKIEQSRTFGGKVSIVVFSIGASHVNGQSNENTITIDFGLEGSALTIN